MKKNSLKAMKRKSKQNSVLREENSVAAKFSVQDLLKTTFELNIEFSRYFPLAGVIVNEMTVDKFLLFYC